MTSSRACCLPISGSASPPVCPSASRCDPFLLLLPSCARCSATCRSSTYDAAAGGLLVAHTGAMLLSTLHTGGSFERHAAPTAHCLSLSLLWSPGGSCLPCVFRLWAASSSSWARQLQESVLPLLSPLQLICLWQTVLHPCSWHARG